MTAAPQTIEDDPVEVVEDDLTEDLLGFYFGPSDEQESDGD